MEGEEKKGKGFVFVDKRKTHDTEGTGESQADVPKSSGPGDATKEAQRAERPTKDAEPDRSRRADQSLPAVDFNALILSLSSSVMMHLGVLPNPVSHETEADLPLAKQTIDIIAMLQQKTRGNLTQDEEQFIEAVLYDLRMKYVEVSREKT